MTREEAIKQLKSLYDYCQNILWKDDCDAIKLALSALRPVSREQVEALRGEWIDKPTGSYGRWQTWCSACGKHSGIGGIKSNRHSSFCPNCGTPMTDEAVQTVMNRLEGMK